MLVPLTIALALSSPSAPLPAAQDTSSSVPPQILELKPDADGKIRLQVIRTQNRTVKAIAGNGRNVQQIERSVPYQTVQQVELADVKDLTGYTVDGKSLDRKEILEKLANGGIVVVSGDGQKVNPAFLKIFRDDVLVLVSPEFANLPPDYKVAPDHRLNPGAVEGFVEVPQRRAPVPGNVAPLPAPAPGPVGKPIQVLPQGGANGIGVAPAIVPAVPPVKVPPIRRQPIELEPAPVPPQPANTK
jgi:hypothetical protein